MCSPSTRRTPSCGGALRASYLWLNSGDQLLIYTGTWFVKALVTLFVCGDTSCEAAPQLDASAGEALEDAILDLDKTLLLSYGTDSNSAALGVVGGGSPIFSVSADEAIVSQLRLEDGSVAFYMLAALASAIAPFLVGYAFLLLHAGWLRQRGSTPLRAHVATAGADQGTSVIADTVEGGCVRGDAPVKRGLTLLLGAAVAAVVVMLPVAVNYTASTVTGGIDFEQYIPLACPSCINGVPSEGIAPASPGGVAYTTRGLLLAKSVQVRLCHAYASTILNISPKLLVFRMLSCHHVSDRVCTSTKLG